MDANTFAYDVFLSHASADKASFVGPLAVALSDRGLKIWYDDFELRIGDSLRQSIDHGLSRSRYGIVVLSKAFFSRSWPQKELAALVAQEDGINKRILPVWHDVSAEDVRQFSPLLSDRLARSSAIGIQRLANEIAAVVGEETGSVGPTVAEQLTKAEEQARGLADRLFNRIDELVHEAGLFCCDQGPSIHGNTVIVYFDAGTDVPRKLVSDLNREVANAGFQLQVSEWFETGSVW